MIIWKTQYGLTTNSQRMGTAFLFNEWCFFQYREEMGKVLYMSSLQAMAGKRTTATRMATSVIYIQFQ